MSSYVERVCRFLIVTPLLPILVLIGYMEATDHLQVMPVAMALLGLSATAMVVDVVVDVVGEIRAYRKQRLDGAS